MKVRLEIIEGTRKDKLKPPFEIDRSEPDVITAGRSARKSERYGEAYPHIQISSEDLRLSRWHFMLKITPPSCYICDMGSTNKTYLNGNPIEEVVELKEGDIIKAGRTYLRVHIAPDEVKGPQKFTCTRCGREIEGPEVKSPEEIGASDFICEACRRKGQIPGKEFSANCFNCGKDLTDNANKDGRAEELKDVALYLCEDCSMSEREMKEKIRDYIFLKEIGRGGMSIVHKAWHKPTGRIVAIKELLPDRLMDERSLKIFHREISITSELIHPNVVRFYDSFSRRGKPYLVTEYLPGGSAEDMLIRREGCLSVEEACSIIIEALEGLSFAHKRGIVHRDFSPGNILFDRNGRAKLSDMGLAKSFELAGQSNVTKDETGGKVLYMPPEQIFNFRFVKPPADVYSAGVCLYYLLTGKFPYYFPSPLDILMRLAGLKEVKHPFAIILEDDPIPIMERRSDLPKPLSAVIDRCLRKDPGERFKDAEELKEAIKSSIN